MRGYAILGQRRVRPLSEGQTRCACVTVGRRSRLFAWVGCRSCRGTGVADAPNFLRARGVRSCNASSATEGM